MQILWLIGVAIGFLIVWKSEWLYQNFGTVSWAEQHLGTEGGTRLFYKLFGMVIIIISMLGVSGMLGGLVLGIFGKMFGGMATT